MKQPTMLRLLAVAHPLPPLPPQKDSDWSCRTATDWKSIGRELFKKTYLPEFRLEILVIQLPCNVDQFIKIMTTRSWYQRGDEAKWGWCNKNNDALNESGSAGRQLRHTVGTNALVSFVRTAPFLLPLLRPVNLTWTGIRMRKLYELNSTHFTVTLYGLVMSTILYISVVW